MVYSISVLLTLLYKQMSPQSVSLKLLWCVAAVSGFVLKLFQWLVANLPPIGKRVSAQVLASLLPFVNDVFIMHSKRPTVLVQLKRGQWKSTLPSSVRCFSNEASGRSIRPYIAPHCSNRQIYRVYQSVLLTYKNAPVGGRRSDWGISYGVRNYHQA